MEKRRASSSRWCLLTALVFGCFCGDGTAEDIRIYNPSGWNLPETSDLQFVSREIISHPDIPVTLEVEKYESKVRSTRDEYFVLNAFVDKGKVVPDLFVREYPEQLKVFRDAQTGDILCYYYVRLAEYMPRSELAKTPEGRETIAFQVPVDAYISYVVDLDDDGRFESEYDFSLFEFDEMKGLVEVLKFKFAARRG